MMNETWKYIPGYEPKYQVSSLGRIRSFCSTNGFLSKEPKILKPSKESTTKYAHVTLVKDGKKSTKLIHQIVAETFIGPKQDGLVVCHKNDIKYDNRLENLMYGTQKENVAQAFKNNKMVHGERVNTAKLKKEDISEIKKLYSEGMTKSEISRKYKISNTHAARIVNSNCWRHI